MESGIYEIVNKVNGKRYIGSAVNLKNRLRSHLNSLKKNSHRNSHLQAAWNKYGAETFIFTVRCYVNKEMLILREQVAIDAYKWEDLYNIAPTAGSSLGLKRTAEAKKNMSDASKKKWQDPDIRKSYVDAAVERAKTSVAIDAFNVKMKNRERSIEERSKISSTLKGRVPWNKGKNMPREIVEKQRLKNIGRRHSPESIEKMRQANKKKWTPEFRAKRAATIAKKREIREREKLG